MKTPRNQIASVIAKLSLNSDVKSEDLGQEIAAYLLSEKRTGELDSLLRDVVSYRADQGIVEVTAVSANRLTPETRDEIRVQVHELYEGAQKIIINERVNKNIVGGVRLELIGRQLDLSVRAKLNRFKKLTTLERTT